MLSDKINSLPISQTVAMTAKAHDLKNQGVDVPYMVKENEGHGFYNEENRFDFYRAMTEFLDKYLQN